MHWFTVMPPQFALPLQDATQVPFWHALPGPQALPQTPQLALSEAVLASHPLAASLSQSRKAPVQLAITHVPF